MQMPLTAIVAVTYRCNARCKMCDIWKKQTTTDYEMPPSSYALLPKTLRDINVTGGEPFLRGDLHEIVRVMKKACPRARIVISTNGLLTERIRSIVPKLLEQDTSIAVRVSVDGIGIDHDNIRGVPQAFEKAMSSIRLMKDLGVKDLGIATTLTSANEEQLLDIYHYSISLGVEFSVTLVSESEIYFGMDKCDLRPKAPEKLKALSAFEYLAWNPRRWFRGWFASSLAYYASTGKRYLSCDAGSGFFYLDPQGDVYACHLKSAFMGNLSRQNFKDIWCSEQADKVRAQLKNCEDCWMVCTCKSELLKRRMQVGQMLLQGKIKAHFKR